MFWQPILIDPQTLSIGISATRFILLGFTFYVWWYPPLLSSFQNLPQRSVSLKRPPLSQILSISIFISLILTQIDFSAQYWKSSWRRDCGYLVLLDIDHHCSWIWFVSVLIFIIVGCCLLVLWWITLNSLQSGDIFPTKWYAELFVCLQMAVGLVYLIAFSALGMAIFRTEALPAQSSSNASNSTGEYHIWDAQPGFSSIWAANEKKNTLNHITIHHTTTSNLQLLSEEGRFEDGLIALCIGFLIECHV